MFPRLSQKTGSSLSGCWGSSRARRMCAGSSRHLARLRSAPCSGGLMGPVRVSTYTPPSLYPIHPDHSSFVHFVSLSLTCFLAVMPSLVFLIHPCASLHRLHFLFLFIGNNCSRLHNETIFYKYLRNPHLSDLNICTSVAICMK